MMMLSQDQRDKLSKRMQNAGTEVVEAKQGAVSLFFFFNLQCTTAFSISLLKQIIWNKP